MGLQFFFVKTEFIVNLKIKSSFFIFYYKSKFIFRGTSSS